MERRDPSNPLRGTQYGSWVRVPVESGRGGHRGFPFTAVEEIELGPTRCRSRSFCSRGMLVADLVGNCARNFPLDAVAWLDPGSGNSSGSRGPHLPREISSLGKLGSHSWCCIDQGRESAREEQRSSLLPLGPYM